MEIVHQILCFCTHTHTPTHTHPHTPPPHTHPHTHTHTHTHAHAHTPSNTKGLLPEEGERRENENGFDIGSRDLIADEFSPSDASDDQDERGEGNHWEVYCSRGSRLYCDHYHYPSLYCFVSLPLLLSLPFFPFPLSPAETSPVELTNLEKSLSVIIDSLKQQNATLVKAVQDLVSELCRITLLWDEMWLAALMQRQGEVHRCVWRNVFCSLSQI